MRPAEADLPNIYPANPIWNRPFITLDNIILLIPLHVLVVSFPFRTIEGQLSKMALSTVPFTLVVDVDPMILMDTTSILDDAGFWFYEAMDDEEAKQVLPRHWESIVLLFSDLNMPR